ncbi:hypothetical protein J7J18_05955 [bacterium]|nr:hypothetical protein [bacterium]
MTKEGRFVTAINCMDGRVQLPLINYLKSRYRADYVDMITLPGPNKILAEKKDRCALRSVKRCIGISVNLHGSGLIVLAGHYDCGGNPANKKIQEKQTKKAAKLVSSWFPNVRIICLWINRNWQVKEIK